MLISPVTNRLLWIERHVHYMLFAFALLPSRDELAFDCPVQSIKTHHGPMARNRSFADPKLVTENHPATFGAREDQISPARKRGGRRHIQSSAHLLILIVSDPKPDFGRGAKRVGANTAECSRVHKAIRAHR